MSTISDMHGPARPGMHVEGQAFVAKRHKLISLPNRKRSWSYGVHRHGWRYSVCFFFRHFSVDPMDGS